MSIFGAMFAPDQERTAAELLRVTRPGGRIGWSTGPRTAASPRCSGCSSSTPGGRRPAPYRRSSGAARTGSVELFGDGIVELRAERRPSRQVFRSADHYLEFFRAYFGPLKTAFDKVGPEGAPALEADLRAYLEEVNTNERALVIEPEYLQVVAIRA